jgi:hypothetical protein
MSLDPGDDPCTMPHLGTCAEPDGRTAGGHNPCEPPMTNRWIRTRPLRRITLATATMLVALLSCAKGDVGAPCNHGDTEPPASKLVTFPALSCDELLCVYADVSEAPEDACEAGDHAACNEAQPEVDRFQCVTEPGESSGECQLKIEYVLERSMCSKKCSSDSDCKDGGVGNKVVVENTNCQLGFKCARIQTLGKFCCEKLCVCEDDLDLATAEMIQEECFNGTQEGCCMGPGVEPSPACGT